MTFSINYWTSLRSNNLLQARDGDSRAWALNREERFVDLVWRYLSNLLRCPHLLLQSALQNSQDIAWIVQFVDSYTIDGVISRHILPPAHVAPLGQVFEREQILIARLNVMEDHEVVVARALGFHDCLRHHILLNFVA